MKNYRFTIIVAHTRFTEERNTNIQDKADRAYRNGHFVQDNTTGLEYIPAL